MSRPFRLAGVYPKGHDNLAVAAGIEQEFSAWMHPSLREVQGYVARSGAVRALVTVPEEYASGSGKLSGTTGRGAWSAHSGNAGCAGVWSAHRN